MFSTAPKLPSWSLFIKNKPIWANLIFTFVYIAVASCGFFIEHIQGKISPFSPATGLAFAAVFLGGWRLIPGVALGAFAVNLLTDYGTVASLLLAGGNSAEALVALLLLEIIRPYIRNLQGYLLPVWLVLSSLIAPLTAATAGAFALCFVAETSPGAYFDEIWLIWWSSHAIGSLVVTPAILTLHPVKFSANLLIKVALFALLYGATHYLVFEVGDGSPFLFAIFPVLLLACIWFGSPGSTWVVLAFVISALIATSIGHFSAPDANPYHRLLFFNIFIASLAVTSMILSALYVKGFFGIPAVILMAGWILSGVLYYFIRSTAVETNHVNFQSLVTDAENRILYRLNKYTDALRASASYFVNSEKIDEKEWSAFIRYLNVQTRYPGMRGIGIILPENSDAFHAHLNNLSKEERDAFQITPVSRSSTRSGENADAASERFIIVFYHSLIPIERAVGINLATESNRRTAAIRARDSGEPSISGRILLLNDERQRPGFHFLFPIYDVGTPASTVDERHDAFIGWAFAPVITELFFEGILGDRADEITMTVFDRVDPATSGFAFSSSSLPSELEKNGIFRHTSQLELGGQVFKIGWNRGPNFAMQKPFVGVLMAASFAIGTSLLAAFIASLQAINRKERLNTVEASRAR